MDVASADLRIAASLGIDASVPPSAAVATANPLPQTPTDSRPMHLRMNWRARNPFDELDLMTAAELCPSVFRQRSTRRLWPRHGWRAAIGQRDPAYSLGEN